MQSYRGPKLSKRRISMRIVAVLLVAVAFAVSIGSAYKLTIIDLGVQPGFNFSRAYHLSGDLVVGTSHGDHIPFPTTAFLFNVTTKTTRSIGRMGARDTESGRGRANAKGRLVGMAIKPHHSTDVPAKPNLDEPALNIWRRPRTERSPIPIAPPHDTRAFVWENGFFDDIGLRFNWTFSVANAINAKGQVVGTYWRPDNTTSAYIYDSNTKQLRDLGAQFPRNDTQGHAISETGEVVGWGSGLGAVIWDANGKLTAIPESENSEAINDRGEIAGSALSGHFLSDPVIWRRSGSEFTKELLGCHYALRDCLPTDINTRAKPDVVGVVRARGLPWFYDGSNGKLSHLNQLLPKDTPFQTLIAVHSIDDQRRIVGDGQLKTGAYHAFMLTIEDTPTASDA